MVDPDAVPLEPSAPSLDEEDREALSHLAWDVLTCYVSGKTFREQSIPRTGVLGEPWGVFVTLYSKGQLRGCIGNAAPQLPLAEAVVEKALAAASRDPRFPPLTRGEMKDLEIDISVLSPLVRLEGEPEVVIRAVRPNVHGLCVRLGAAHGLLLPQVCRRFGWGAEEFLRQTALKADLDAEAWRDPQAEIYVFTALSFSADRPPAQEERGKAPESEGRARG